MNFLTVKLRTATNGTLDIQGNEFVILEYIWFVSIVYMRWTHFYPLIEPNILTKEAIVTISTLSKYSGLSVDKKN